MTELSEGNERTWQQFWKNKLNENAVSQYCMQVYTCILAHHCAEEECKRDKLRKVEGNGKTSCGEIGEQNFHDGDEILASNEQDAVRNRMMDDLERPFIEDHEVFDPEKFCKADVPENAEIQAF